MLQPAQSLFASQCDYISENNDLTYNEIGDFLDLLADPVTCRDVQVKSEIMLIAY